MQLTFKEVIAKHFPNLFLEKDIWKIKEVCEFILKQQNIPEKERIEISDLKVK